MLKQEGLHEGRGVQPAAAPIITAALAAKGKAVSQRLLAVGTVRLSLRRSRSYTGRAPCPRYARNSLRTNGCCQAC